MLLLGFNNFHVVFNVQLTK